MNKVGEALIGIIAICGFAYGMLTLISIPNKQYITRINIEGREMCFHGNSTKDIYYYEMWCGLHTHMVHVVNDAETLDDEIEKMTQEFKSYDELVNRYKDE